MKRIRKPMQVEAIIPTASMADISFLLIVFFMVTFKVVPEKTEVKVPKSNVREDITYLNDSAWIAIVPEDVDQGTVKVTWGERMKGETMTLDAFSATIPGILAEAKYGLDTTFVLKADAEIRYSYIDLVVEVIKKNGIKDVMLLTEQKTVGD